jgi:hypothetical protein
VLRTGQGTSRTCRKVKWHQPVSKDKQSWFEIEWFLYTLSVNAFHSGYNALPLTNRKHVNLHTGQGTYKMQKYYDE